MRSLNRILRNQRGTSLVQYCLLASLVASACFLSVNVVGRQVSVRVCDAASAFESGVSGHGEGGTTCTAGSGEEGAEI